MLYLNTDENNFKLSMWTDKGIKNYHMNRCNHYRKLMNKEKIGSDTAAADNRPVSKPRINYWLEKARQHEWIAAGYEGIAKMIEEGGRNRDGDIARAKMDAYSFRESAKEYKFRAGHPAYPQYTVEV